MIIEEQIRVKYNIEIGTELSKSEGIILYYILAEK